MSNHLKTKSGVSKKNTKKLMFRGGSPDAVKRDKPKGKKKQMKMK